MNNILSEVQAEMAAMGWRGDPASGFVFKEHETLIVAHRGDSTWVEDCERAADAVQARLNAKSAMRELLRRAR